MYFMYHDLMRFLHTESEVDVCALCINLVRQRHKGIKILNCEGAEKCYQPGKKQKKSWK